MSKRIIVGGTGFIGQALIKRWRKLPIEIMVVSRSAQKTSRLFGNVVTHVSWEMLLAEPEYFLHDCECIINLAGTNVGEKRWSPARKAELIDSRVQTTKTLVDLCINNTHLNPKLINASAIGIYGAQQHAATELPPALIESQHEAIANDFLASLGRSWEAVTLPALQAGIPIVLLRFAVVLGKNGGALSKIDKPFRLGMGCYPGSGQQPFCWISLEDACRAIEFLIAHPALTGAFNLAAPGTVHYKTFAQVLARMLDDKICVSIPAWLIKLVFGEMGDTLLLKGQNAAPARLVESGFEFRYPSIEQALKAIYQSDSAVP